MIIVIVAAVAHCAPSVTADTTSIESANSSFAAQLAAGQASPSALTEFVNQVAAAEPEMIPASVQTAAQDMSGFNLIATYNDCARSNWLAGKVNEANACMDATLQYGANLAAQTCIAVKDVCREYRIIKAQKAADYAVLSNGVATDDDITFGDAVRFFTNLIYKAFKECLIGADHDKDSNEMYVNDDAVEDLIRVIACGVAAIVFGGAIYGLYRAHKHLGHNPYKRYRPSTLSPIDEVYRANPTNSAVTQTVGIYQGYGDLIQADPFSRVAYGCFVIGLDSHATC